ncbi:MAG: hypothetical protein CBC52_004370, partial [Gammaproteobacteria bacterium TMED92]
MGWVTLCRRVLVLMGLVLSSQALGQAGLVLGSYGDLDNAEARRAEVQLVLGQAAQIVPATVQGREVFRVVVAAEPMSMQRLQSQAENNGLGRGWRLELPPATAV